MSVTEPVEVFLSYSHKDEGLKDELLKHLALLRRDKVITAWHDRKIGAGGEWAHEIDSHLNTARIILLLVSADFLASDYCFEVEMKRAMQRHDLGESCVIPVILRNVDWTRAPFAKLNALPRDGKPVTSWPNPDEAFAYVAKGVREEIEKPVEPLVEKLRKVESLQDWTSVVNIGDRILKLVPEHAYVCKAMARAYIGRWSRNVEMVPMFGDVHFKFRRRQKGFTAGMDNMALQTLMLSDINRAIELDRTNADFYYIRSCVESDNDARIRDLTQAIKLNPQDAKYYYRRGILLDRQDDKEAAERDFRSVLNFGFEQSEKPVSKFSYLELEPPGIARSLKDRIDESKLGGKIMDDLERIWGPTS